ncbi:hypothetical protein SAMN04488137_0294 [Fictibacillus solisalsi]|uniref:Uncharacterized protein n=1 Tax=Fictibacillus solisalsi TaxID=459525 RepID=A0A1G9TH92_9BACL|nr:hypothetical protein [Fictibacillus solisalsi]SDM47116.1 hypothetical protein SAMN04488137_0294 [Fictibacillus solisalsi]
MYKFWVAIPLLLLGIWLGYEGQDKAETSEKKAKAKDSESIHTLSSVIVSTNQLHHTDQRILLEQVISTDQLFQDQPVRKIQPQNNRNQAEKEKVEKTERKALESKSEKKERKNTERPKDNNDHKGKEKKEKEKQKGKQKGKQNGKQKKQIKNMKEIESSGPDKHPSKGKPDKTEKKPKKPEPPQNEDPKDKPVVEKKPDPAGDEEANDPGDQKGAPPPSENNGNDQHEGSNPLTMEKQDTE